MQKLNQINQNIFTISDFFTQESLESIADVYSNRESNEFLKGIESTDLVEQFTNNQDKLQNNWFGREKFAIPDHKDPIFKDATSTINKHLGGYADSISLWKDYPYFENPIHYDCQECEHIIIVYISGSKLNGTTVWNEEQRHFVQITPEPNRALVLKNSGNILHGMSYFVPEGTTRKSVYINWTSTKKRLVFE